MNSATTRSGTKIWPRRSPPRIVKQLALAQQAVDELVPGYRFRSLSLPFGAWPHQKSLAVTGTYEGTTYKNLAILLVGAGPAPRQTTAASTRWPFPRIQAGDGPFGPEQTLRRLQKSAHGRFISDGDPGWIAVPAALAAHLQNGLQDRGHLAPSRNRRSGRELGSPG